MFPVLAETSVTAPQNPLMWAGIAIGGVVILYTVLNPLRRKRKAADPLAKGPPSAGLAQQRSVERQMQNLLVELSEMARQITAQLDTRAAKLQALIDEADARLAALRATTASAPAEPPMFSRATDAEPVVPADEVPMFRTPAPRPVDRSPTAAEPAAAVEPTAGPHDAVYALADRGRSAAEIARELDVPRGEVDLILALRSPA